MKVITIALTLLCPATTVLADACWHEWTYKEQQMIRAGVCYENVSMPDFERGFCTSRIEGDVLRRAASCPISAKTKKGTEIVTISIIARCLKMNPPGTEGRANIIHYSGVNYEQSRDSLYEMCTGGLEGTWVGDMR